MSSKSLLLIGHPGHEVLLYGWIARVRPRVCILTDGSGYSSQPRLSLSRDLLFTLGAQEGPIFGRFTDREMYAVLREGRGDVVAALVRELSEDLYRQGIDTIVVDAMEGFNPVHDLCRVIAGAAAGGIGSIPLYEYPVDAGPDAYDGDPGATLFDLDDATLAAKINAGRTLRPAIPDVDAMLSRSGEEAFRRESLRPVHDWTAPGWDTAQRPQYEVLGEERVAMGRYDHVIRYEEHFLPLLDAVRAVASLSC